MSADNDVQAPANVGVITLEESVSSITVQPDSICLPTRPNPSGGIGPTRRTRFHPTASVNAALETKYGTVMKGFKVLQTTCKDLQVKLANCEEKIRSGERAYAMLMKKVYDHQQAYTALEEKARSAEVSHTETISKLKDQIQSYDTAYKQLVSQAEEENRSGMANFREQISKMEERIRFNEASCMELVSQMEGKVQASEAACSELVSKVEECGRTLEECERTLKDRESDLTSLRNAIQESIACGICYGIPVQPCSTECRHIFCAMCLLTWWENDQKTSCPMCRSIAKTPPVRDPVQGFVAMARAQAGEEEEDDSFDANLFDDFFPAESDSDDDSLPLAGSNNGHNRDNAIIIP